jgi:DNA replication protein DnaC
MESLPFDERFGMMLDAECDSRNNRKLAKLLRDATLKDPSACLEQLDFRVQRDLKKEDIARLSDCGWVKRGQTLLITGATGCGKTYIASAFGNAVCRRGMSVRSYRMPRFLEKLAASIRDGTYDDVLNELKKPSLLILDDFGISSMSPSACRHLLEVIDDRYKNKATIITAQLPVAEWRNIMEDKTVGDAIMDRLVSQSYRIALKGASMRRSDTPKPVIGSVSPTTEGKAKEA